MAFDDLISFYEIAFFGNFDSVYDWRIPGCFNPSFWRYSNRKRDERRFKSEIPDNISQQEISRSVPDCLSNTRHVFTVRFDKRATLKYIKGISPRKEALETIIILNETDYIQGHVYNRPSPNLPILPNLPKISITSYNSQYKKEKPKESSSVFMFKSVQRDLRAFHIVTTTYLYYSKIECFPKLT